MIVAEQKKKENIAEYILYMWQVEDIIRALDFDEIKLKEYVDTGYKLPPEQMEKVFLWYVMLATKMQEEGLQIAGHLQMLRNIIADLEQLAQRLLKEPTQTLYASIYYQTLPSIIQLKGLGTEQAQGEVETCFIGIYGYLLLKARNEEVSEETEAAIEQFSTFLAVLADRYRLIQEGHLVLKKEEE